MTPLPDRPGDNELFVRSAIAVVVSIVAVALALFAPKAFADRMAWGLLVLTLVLISFALLGFFQASRRDRHRQVVDQHHSELLTAQLHELPELRAELRDWIAVQQRDLHEASTDPSSDSATKRLFRSVRGW
jgi:type VI protein secretion system component VasK